MNKRPGILRRAGHFSLAFISHICAGMPTCTQDEIDERLAVCQRCKLFDEQQAVCLHESCGCNVNGDERFFNKLAWADQYCPLLHWNKRGELWFPITAEYLRDE